MSGFYEQVMDIIMEERNRRGSFRAVAEPVGIPVVTIQKWFNTSNGDKPRSPNLLDVAKIMDFIGVSVRNSENEIVRIGTEDAEHALEVQKLRDEIISLKMENARLKGQVDILKEYVIVPCKATAK